MAADDLAPPIADDGRSQGISSHDVDYIDNHILVFHKEEFQLSAPSLGQHMIETINRYLCFLKIQHKKG